MTVKHHPSDAALLAYAAGHLGEGLSLLIAAHLTFCPACRRIVAGAEAIGGLVLEGTPPIPLRPDTRGAMLARLNDPAPIPPVPARRTPHETAEARPPGLAPSVTLPRVLDPYITGLTGTRWQWMGPGVRMIDVVPRSLGSDSARLLRIAPGRVLPRHGHAGLEMTLVLSGSYADEQGRFTRGDLAELGGGTQHRPIADSSEDCLCLIGTNAPVRFLGLVPRIMAPLMGV